METDFRTSNMQTNAHVQVELGNNEFGGETKLIMRPRNHAHSAFHIIYKRKLNINGSIEAWNLGGSTSIGKWKYTACNSIVKSLTSAEEILFCAFWRNASIILATWIQEILRKLWWTRVARPSFEIAVGQHRHDIWTWNLSIMLS